MFQEGFKELLDEFLLEAHERANEVEASLLRLRSNSPDERQAALAQAKRELHTLKGNSGMMGFVDLQQLAHHMEDEVEMLDLDSPVIDSLLTELDILRQTLHTITPEADPTQTETATPSESSESRAAENEPRDTGGSVRVPFSRIDQLVEMQAETLIYRNRLADSIHNGQALLKDPFPEDPGEQQHFINRLSSSWDEVEMARQSLEKTLRLLQEQTTNLGMVPLQGLFRSLRRVVHDESSRQDKRVELVIQGGDTPIDKTLLEAAGDALGHLVRNAVIHGIEAPDRRLAQGKPDTGQVTVSATLDANQVWIEVRDDGAGIDLASLRQRAAAAQTSEIPLGSDFNLLFEEGVSTHSGTDIGAGRGVGMAAVKDSVESHGGRIEVQSQRHVGTTFTIRLPVTASILRSILLRADDEEYALPLTAVVEALRPAEQERHHVNGAPVLKWRRQLVPIIDLGQHFDTRPEVRPEGSPIIIEINGRFRALLIDDIVGIRDIVVKGLDSLVGRPAGISGSTILGDGRVIMILDPAVLTALSPFALTAASP